MQIRKSDEFICQVSGFSLFPEGNDAFMKELSKVVCREMKVAPLVKFEDDGKEILCSTYGITDARFTFEAVDFLDILLNGRKLKTVEQRTLANYVGEKILDQAHSSIRYFHSLVFNSLVIHPANKISYEKFGMAKIRVASV